MCRAVCRRIRDRDREVFRRTAIEVGRCLQKSRRGVGRMIRVLITGGTFDKEYDELKGQLYFNATHLPEMLRLGRCRVPVEAETVMLVDSLHMTDADRARIA